MAIKRDKTTTQKGLGWQHQQAAKRLRNHHVDGTPCAHCGRPMYLDRTRNWDYDPSTTNPYSGTLHADHGGMSRAEAIRRGLPIPLPDRLLHGTCNIQLGDGEQPTDSDATSTPCKLYMPWPWPVSA